LVSDSRPELDNTRPMVVQAISSTVRELDVFVGVLCEGDTPAVSGRRICPQLHRNSAAAVVKSGVDNCRRPFDRDATISDE